MAASSSSKKELTFKFLDDLDKDLRLSLTAQIRNLWTHTSTALEGNTLTLGETAFVIEEGLTVSGKPLKDHQEVVGHARAIDIIYELLQQQPAAIQISDLFRLHTAVQTSITNDIYQPIGAWKREPNGTYSVVNGKQVYIEYAPPENVPALMDAWLHMLNMALRQPLSEEAAAGSYADLHLLFVHIHPFFDGNGRLARLIANLPVLSSGFPPVVIPKEKRREYLVLLADYQLSVKQLDVQNLLIFNSKLEAFRQFCQDNWQAVWGLVHEARITQRRRTNNDKN